LGVVAAVVLALDVGTKAWAELALSASEGKAAPVIVLIDRTLSLALAYNEGGAWGLFQTADATIRRPFFLVVSLLAIGFIISLYRKLLPGQWALRWGLPLVLGGALGNLSDRVARSGVVDFILYRADWVGTMNEWISYFVSGWTKSEYWPTFNVADIAICAGVGLMAVDMVISRRAQPSPDDTAGSGELRNEPSDPPESLRRDSTAEPSELAATTDP
jgi:signal peptidase II